MSRNASFDAKLSMGKKYEKIFGRYLAEKGYHVVMTCELAHDDGKGPRVYASNGREIVSPDVLGIDEGGKAWMFEVKAKTMPSYRFTHPWRGWWHGVDLRLFEKDYRELSKRTDFWFVVCEINTLPYIGAVPKHAGHSADFDASVASFVVPGPVWRAISYSDAEIRGREADGWSKGRCGWLWPLEAMRVIKVPGSVDVKPAPPQEAAVFLRRPSPSVLAPMSEDAGPLGYQLGLAL